MTAVSGPQCVQHHWLYVSPGLSQDLAECRPKKEDWQQKKDRSHWTPGCGRPKFEAGWAPVLGPSLASALPPTVVSPLSVSLPTHFPHGRAWLVVGTCGSSDPPAQSQPSLSHFLVVDRRLAAEEGSLPKKTWPRKTPGGRWAPVQGPASFSPSGEGCLLSPTEANFTRSFSLQDTKTGVRGGPSRSPHCRAQLSTARGESNPLCWQINDKYLQVFLLRFELRWETSSQSQSRVPSPKEVCRRIVSLRLPGGFPPGSPVSTQHQNYWISKFSKISFHFN